MAQNIWTVEYFRLWPDQSWDQDTMNVPAETNPEDLEQVVRQQAAQIEWPDGTPLAVGVLYKITEEFAESMEEVKIMPEMIKAASGELGRFVDRDEVLRALEAYNAYDARAVKVVWNRLVDLTTAFSGFDGRPAAVNAEIDRLRIALHAGRVYMKYAALWNLKKKGFTSG